MRVLRAGRWHPRCRQGRRSLAGRSGPGHDATRLRWGGCRGGQGEDHGEAAAGHEIGDATIAHLTPARFEAINPYGLLTFEVAKILNRTNRRPLRTL